MTCSVNQINTCAMYMYIRMQCKWLNSTKKNSKQHTIITKVMYRDN